MIFKYLLSMAARQFTRRRKSRVGMLLAVGAGAAVAGAAAGALLWPRHGSELGEKIKNRAEKSADRLKKAVNSAEMFGGAKEDVSGPKYEEGAWNSESMQASDACGCCGEGRHFRHTDQPAHTEGAAGSYVSSDHPVRLEDELEDPQRFASGQSAQNEDDTVS
jgi:gas vesicle protein